MFVSCLTHFCIQKDHLRQQNLLRQQLPQTSTIRWDKVLHFFLSNDMRKIKYKPLYTRYILCLLVASDVSLEYFSANSAKTKNDELRTAATTTATTTTPTTTKKQQKQASATSNAPSINGGYLVLIMVITARIAGL